MNDSDAIQQAYAATLGELYRTMLNSYVIARGDAAAEAEADSAFENGLREARVVRDKAIGLLSSGPGSP